jgi:hypothetical protein
MSIRFVGNRNCKRQQGACHPAATSIAVGVTRISGAGAMRDHRARFRNSGCEMRRCRLTAEAELGECARTE